MAKPLEDHYLKPTKRSGAPTCVMSVAVTQGRKDKRNGYESTFEAAAVRHECKKHHGKGGPICEDFVTRDADALWDWITGRVSSGHRLLVVSIDLQQLFQTARGYERLLAMGWDPKYLRLDSGGSGAEWRRDARRIVMCDLYTWIPKPFGQIRRLADVGRTSAMAVRAEWGDAESSAAAYCADINAVWRDIAGWISDSDLGEWKTTGASMSLSVFRHRFITHDMVSHGDADRRAVERQSAYGGRAEAYRIGRLGRGPWFEWDLAAAYARICATTSLPVRDSGTSQRPSLRSVLSPAVGRCQLVEADVATKVATLPWEGTAGICWPVGTFRGVWWDRELRQAVADGATVTPRRSWHYRTAPALASWAGWILGCLDGSEPDMTAVRVAVAKHWSRALIGKFGSRYRVFEDIGESLEPGKLQISYMTPERGQYKHLISGPKRTFMQSGWTDASNSIPAIMSYVMMETRMWLWDAMTNVGLDNVVHCDTDGFITNKTGNAIMEREAGNEWRRKGQWRKLYVYGSQRLNGDLDRRLPGVPKTAIDAGNGRYVGEVRLSSAESLARGQMSAILTHRREWVSRDREHRRIIGDNGRTKPIDVIDNVQMTFNK